MEIQMYNDDEIDLTDAILFVSDSAGVYAPQRFAEYILPECIVGAEDNLDILKKGPDHEDYWEAWADVCDNAIVKSKFGVKYSIHQDGDVWLIPEIDQDTTTPPSCTPCTPPTPLSGENSEKSIIVIGGVSAWGYMINWITVASDEPLWMQIDMHYKHGGGWRDFQGFAIEGGNDEPYSIAYPGDPAFNEISRIVVGNETLAIFPYSWVLYDDGKTQRIARID